MNYPESSGRCRVCGFDLRDEWRRAVLVADAEKWMRQILEGACDPCQRRRQEAAVEFMAAADAVRVAWQVARAVFGTRVIDFEPFPQGKREFRILARLMDAERRCRELGMWAPHQWRLPGCFRDSDPYPTERENRHAPHRYASPPAR